MEALFEKFDKKPNIVLIQGSPRREDQCPNHDSKTSKIVNYVKKTIKNANIDIIDLSLNPDKLLIQPCKGCISTAGGSHCVSEGETIDTKTGFKKIEDINVGDELYTGMVSNKWLTNEHSDVYDVILTDGRRIKLTDNHKIKVIKPHYKNNNKRKLVGFDDIWTEVKDLKIGDRIPLPNDFKFDKIPDKSKIGIKSHISDNRHLKTIVRGKKFQRASCLNISSYSNIKIFNEKIKFLHKRKQMYLDRIIDMYEIGFIEKQKDRPTKVKSIKYIGKEEVYDITVDDSHEFEAEGIIVHNCDCYDKSNDKMHSENIYDKLEKSDAFVLFTPIHWSQGASQVKAMFDRLVCINLTITSEEAIEVFGKDNVKDAELTKMFSETKEFKEMKKNRFEGKIFGTYAFGDDGADDYTKKELPKTYTDYCCEFKPIDCVMSYVWQMRYSGIDSPDEFIEAFFLKDKVSYSKEDDLFDEGDLNFMYNKAIKLVEKIIKYID